MIGKTRILLTLLGTMSLAGPVAAADPAGSASDSVATTVSSAASDAVQKAMDERAIYGLPSDRTTVSALLGSRNDVGTLKWGIPMTSDEESYVDLPARMTFAGNAAAEAVPYARNLPGFGGLYFDQSRGGKLVVVMTGGQHDSELATIMKFLPPDGPGAEIRHGQYTFEELSHAWSAADKWPLGVDVLSSGIDEANNMVWLQVRATDLPTVSAQAEAISSRLGVRVGIRATEEAVETCDRWTCANPLKAGNIVRNGGVTGFDCTMGFHVISGTDKQFVTAGHCGYQAAAGWYGGGIGGNGLIGNQTASLYLNGVDFIRVQMPDAQASKNVWGSAWPVASYRAPNSGESICASRGEADLVDCGTINMVFYHWGPSGTACGCEQQGASTLGITAIGGDSGSPVWHIFNSTDVAIGSVSRSNGDIAEMQDAFNFWGGVWKAYGS